MSGCVRLGAANGQARHDPAQFESVSLAVLLKIPHRRFPVLQMRLYLEKLRDRSAGEVRWVISTLFGDEVMKGNHSNANTDTSTNTGGMAIRTVF